MTDLNLLARLDELERRIDDLSKPSLRYEPFEHEAPDWVQDLQRAHAFAGDHLEQATVDVRGEIDQALRERVEADIWKNRAARHLDIRIDSEGGCYHQSMAIYRAIRLAPAVTKTAHLERRCASGAVVVALAADLRIARPDTEILLHLVGSLPSQDRRWTAAEHAEAVRQQSALDRRMLSLIVDRTDADFNTIAKEATHEHPSPLDWCVMNRLVHRIEEPSV